MAVIDRQQAHGVEVELDDGRLNSPNTRQPRLIVKLPNGDSHLDSQEAKNVAYMLVDMALDLLGLDDD